MIICDLFENYEKRKAVGTHFFKNFVSYTYVSYMDSKCSMGNWEKWTMI